MTSIAKRFVAPLFAVLFAGLVAAPVAAQPAPRAFSQPELDQMLAPIALYPDALLSQILMAATYPIEVVAAARWTRANPGLRGEAAVRAVQDEDWDPSVKSLVAFPQILQRMDEQLDWTRSLGDAFLAQEPQLMEEVQRLRRRAQAAGNLHSDAQIRVEQQGPTIVVQPAAPQVVYVPYYDPLVVYGQWWWPAYLPVAWAPWPGYARPYRPGISVGFWWGQPVSLSVGFFFGNVDWHRRQVRVVHPGAYYYRPPVVVVNRTVNRTLVVERGRWQHDPHHRRQVDYRAPDVRQRYASTQVERRSVQRDERRGVQPQPRPRPQTQARPVAPARTEQPVVRQAPPKPQAQPQQRTPARVAQPQPQQRMPAAVAPQRRPAERQAHQQERREQRRDGHEQREQREERGRKS